LYEVLLGTAWPEHTRASGFSHDDTLALAVDTVVELPRIAVSLVERGSRPELRA
jgi:hypothetical protein